MGGNVINDISFAFLGYIASHLLSLDYIYKHRQYIIERLHFERQNNFDRDTFDLEAARIASGQASEPDSQKLKEKNLLLQEYPFAEFVTQSDLDIRTNRLQSPEEQEHIAVQKERIDLYYKKQADYEEDLRQKRLAKA